MFLSWVSRRLTVTTGCQTPRAGWGLPRAKSSQHTDLGNQELCFPGMRLLFGAKDGRASNTEYSTTHHSRSRHAGRDSSFSLAYKARFDTVASLLSRDDRSDWERLDTWTHLTSRRCIPNCARTAAGTVVMSHAIPGS